jgi:putative hydrolase of the HAD superfamily
MLPDRRAVIFDLDDTLYPYRRFVLSGFAAVAAYLARTHRFDRRRVLRLLARAAHTPERGRELQVCLEQLGLRATMLPPLLAVLRDHQPTMELPRPAVQTLVRLRAEGWRLGVLTNGVRPLQARKVAALGVLRHVDTVVYATEHGSGLGKPEPEPFFEVLRRLRVEPAHTVFVGDDETCDVMGASGAGLIPIACAAWIPPRLDTRARAVIRRLLDVPDTARAVLEEALNSHAA